MAHNLNAVDGCRSYLTLFGAVGAGVVGVCVEIKFHGAFVLNRPRRPPRHRRYACSMAWRCRFLAARPSQVGRVIAEK